MSMPLQILEQACERVEKTSGRTIPFPLRGISINRDLIKAAIVILNNSPQKTLPQNCRNDIRARTPDGLDLRIKEYLDTDLRTANIISDVLAEAGVVEVVTVMNPRTGRMIKTTKLLEDWSWKEDKENDEADHTNP
jgi:hypothetical protein